ncbi:hypothetical protein L873DRAFT_1793782 [Choiromyces venosus 120613-1]|uniref:Uncharacterized protein n=1 Tax=Choiromyces venosus 120613-1 TaxID=1336337 RepID=A0A3N4J4Z8_9PEZI|nr:hypothetical protein L873DRAFT_1793782 [Choiromyces venosus 120613-1]
MVLLAPEGDGEVVVLALIGFTVMLQQARMESVMSEKVKMLTCEEIWKATPNIKPSESSLPVLPIDLLAKSLIQEKVFSAAKPDNQKWMKIAAAKWRLSASKVSHCRTTATKW